MLKKIKFNNKEKHTMHNEFRNDETVFVCGLGEENGKLYNSVPAKILERDPYYLDYHVKFKDGTEDWILPEHLRKPYARKKKD